MLDDRRLLELSVEPPPRLFPVLRHAPAMWPLIVLCVALTSLFACGQRTLSDEAALWGLKSLNCLTADTFEQFLDPGAAGSGELLQWQPPLMAWINALCLSCGARYASLLIVPALLTAAGLVFMAVAVARQLGDARLGLWTCAILVTNPVMLRLAQEPQPHALGLLLALCTCWGALRHWRGFPGLASPPLVFAGVSLGFCLLAAGPLALAVLAVLMLFAVWQTTGAIVARTETNRPSGVVWKPYLSVFSVATIGLTAFAVGGWWLMMMASRYGMEFWSAWCSWSTGSTSVKPTSDSSLLDSIRQIQGAAAPFFYLALLGAWCAFRRASRGGNARFQMLLLAWVAVGCVTFGLQDCSHPASPSGCALWQQFLLLPLLLLAGIGLLEICDRSVPDPAAFLVLVLTVVDVACLAQEAFWRMEANLPAQRLAPLAAIIPWRYIPGAVLGTLLSIAALVCVLRIFCHSPALVKKRVLSALALVSLVGACTLSVLAVRARSPADDELDEVRIGLSKLTGITRCTLVAVNPSGADDGARTAPLRYLLKSLWPHADISQSESWGAALSPGLARERTDPSNLHLILAWGVRGHSQRPGATGALRAAGPALYYRGLEVATYTQALPASLR